ncbi:hypothetical protein [Synechococcus sp. BA-132 BA5]|uniref:hypothetical protein n=1 Tax=Synechococcus sp. BA-132 BA5 TaxID=3110252 RepID=UPI002B216ADE|nr:hypothetical protein [Synechococcus sp. BA-132 BA5]
MIVRALKGLGDLIPLSVVHWFMGDQGWTFQAGEGVVPTVNMVHIKGHYYQSHTMINPTGVVPVGPEINLLAPHDREHLGGLPNPADRSHQSN